MPRTKADLPFRAAQFRATRFDTAAAKAKAANALAAFVTAGFPRSKFTRRVYDALYLHLFGHIAHTNLEGFYAAWFATPRDQLRWIRHALENPTLGPPDHTWSDVGQAFAAWLKASGLAERQVAAGERLVLVLAVYTIARTLAALGSQPIDRPTLDLLLMRARLQVEERALTRLLPDEIASAEARLLRDTQTHKRFRLTAISANQNAFGLSGYVWVAEDGERWQVHAYRPTCPWSVGQHADVPMRSGEPQWSGLAGSWEVPSRLPNVTRNQAAAAFAAPAGLSVTFKPDTPLHDPLTDVSP